MRISDWSSDVCSSDLPSRSRTGVKRLLLTSSGVSGMTSPIRLSSLERSVFRNNSVCSMRCAKQPPAARCQGEASAIQEDCLVHPHQKVRRHKDDQATEVEGDAAQRPAEHPSELQSLMRTSI